MNITLPNGWAIEVQSHGQQGDLTTLLDFLLWGFMKDAVYMPPMPNRPEALTIWMRA